MMRRYVEYLHGREQDGIVDFGLGDWYDIGPGEPGLAKLTTKALTATAMYYLDLQILQKTAVLLGDGEQAQRLGALSSRVRQAFVGRFFDAKTGQYDRGSQTANAMALVLGLVDSQELSPQELRDIEAKLNHGAGGRKPGRRR